MELTAEPVRSFEAFYRAEWASIRRAVGFVVSDGRIKAIIEHSQYEGRTTYAYEFDRTGGIAPVLGASCGV